MENKTYFVSTLIASAMLILITLISVFLASKLINIIEETEEHNTKKQYYQLELANGDTINCTLEGNNFYLNSFKDSIPKDSIIFMKSINNPDTSNK